jgi:glycosyl transferase family 2
VCANVSSVAVAHAFDQPGCLCDIPDIIVTLYWYAYWLKCVGRRKGWSPVSTVAIALCNYNHARYLDGCLGAIVTQSRPADQIVIVDDGSTDDSKDIILDYAARYPTISPYFNGVNKGVMISLKRAMDAVSCDYVVVTAADDLLLSNFISHNLKVLEKHPSAGLSFSELVSLDGDSGVIDRFATNTSVRNIFDISQLPEYLSPEALREKMKRQYLPIPPNTAVIRLDLLRGFGGFPPELSWCTDTFTCTTLAMRHGACVVPEPLALIRSSPYTASQIAMRSQGYVDVLRLLLDKLAAPEMGDIRAFLRSCPSNMSVYGDLFFEALREKPRDWDLLVSNFVWSELVWPWKEYRRLRAPMRWPKATIDSILWLKNRVSKFKKSHSK